MSGGCASEFSIHQHCFRDPRSSSYEPFPRGGTFAMNSRKRKAEDDAQDTNLDRMASSPSPSPATPTKSLPSSRLIKRARTNIIGRPLSLPRLLETLSPDQLRGVLRSICEQHPDIGNEITSTAPRPSVASALAVLGSYQNTLQESFPYGDRRESDYSYNRVKPELLSLLDALKDYTPNFLPPNEMQPATSLLFLDGATNLIHHLPNWDTFQHARHKYDAYEEIAKAWALVFREAAKKGGGMQLHHGGWSEKIAKHNETSEGRMQEAVNEFNSSIGWFNGSGIESGLDRPPHDSMSIRQQLLSGTYGVSQPIQVGPW